MFQKLLEIINQLLPRDPLAGKEKALAQLDPEKIYVENVSSLLDVSYKSAEAICETAVRQGLFKRQVEVMCPDGSVAAADDSEDKLPETVNCWVEEDGDYEPMRTSELKKSVFYKLVEQNERTSAAYA